MKRVRCPKCDNYITFDETKYTDGQALVFACPNCGKQFGIKIDPNTVLGIAGNLLGIVAVLNYEKTDIITSKAFGMIMKGKF